MSFYLVKVVITTLLIVLISELARRSTLAGALLASIPLVSVLAILWLYFESGDTERIAGLSTSIFWLVLPSLAFFLLLPALLHRGVHFYLSLALSLAATAASYGLMLYLLGRIGIRL